MSPRPKTLGNLQIAAVDEIVEEAMMYLKRGPVDLASEEGREGFRGYLRQTIGIALSHCVYSFQKATHKAIEDANNCIMDPDHNKNVRRMRKEQRERFKAQEEQHRHQQLGKKALQKILSLD